MRSLPSRTDLFVLIPTALAAASAPLLAGRVPVERVVELAGLIVVAMLAARTRVQQATMKDRAIMAPSFIGVFASLLLFGADVATIMAIAVALTAGLASTSTKHKPRDIAIDTAIGIIATQFAGLAYRFPAEALREFGWPLVALPIAAAVLAYHASQRFVGEVLVPLARRRRVDRAWATTLPRGAAIYLVGAGIAAAAVAIIDQRLWHLLPVAAAALSLAYGPYADYVQHLDERHRRHEVIEYLDQGMAVVNSAGHVTLWTDALEHMLGCPRDRAMGASIAIAVPALARTELPRSIDAALSDGKARTVAQIGLTVAARTRVFDVRLAPVSGGVALLWHDVTERNRAVHELKRNGERLALAAEGANDGLWQWNLRTGEFYVSGRWREMVGLHAQAEVVAPQAWLDRVHPEDLPDLQATLQAHLTSHTDVFRHEHRIRHEDGSYRRFLCRGLAVRDGRQRCDRIAGSLTDTTEQAIAQERLRSVGFLDPLTGLYNRAVFVEGLGRRLEEAKVRRLSTSFAVLYLDLDRFKIVNDSLGHLVGDDLLIAASRRLESCLRPGDALARLGGDEFAILLSGLLDDNQANGIALRIQDALSAPFSIGGREVFTSASIGIAFGPAHYTNPDEVMRDADTAMYHAKSRGKARHEIFDEAMHARVRDRLSLENDLRRAISANDFEVHYQPIVSLSSGMCVGFESLVRWTRNGEPVSPATFVPIAEELGLVASLGTWVLQQASHTFADWQRRYPHAGLDCITVNVSSRQLMQHGFVRVVQQAVRESGLRPADLRVEITETALMDSPGEAADVLRELRDFGVKVYLDDFGTGYSSLSHLHKLPVDALKIDRSFVKSLLLPDRPAIVESILALARTLNTSVVAEGIESDVQARELERLGCTHAQGFLFSRPLSTKLAEELVMRRRPLGPKGGAIPEPSPLLGTATLTPPTPASAVSR
jgi:diguanylate cyclase (GGDEF)-like protein/PAS domain S-box-containing protein